MKNICNKTRDKNHPYEIWMCDYHPLFDGPVQYRVLKKYQTPEKEAQNPYASWFCATRSPATFGTWELGDGYVNDNEMMGLGLKSIAHKIFDEAIDGEYEGQFDYLQ